MMAHITYLSDVRMQNKFGRKRRQEETSSLHFDVEFEVEIICVTKGKVSFRALMRIPILPHQGFGSI